MNIGEPKRVVFVEPAQMPEPLRQKPAPERQPERVAPEREPEKVPAGR